MSKNHHIIYWSTLHASGNFQGIFAFKIFAFRIFDSGSGYSENLKPSKGDVKCFWSTLSDLRQSITNSFWPNLNRSDGFHMYNGCLLRLPILARSPSLLPSLLAFQCFIWFSLVFSHLFSPTIGSQQNSFPRSASGKEFDYCKDRLHWRDVDSIYEERSCVRECLSKDGTQMFR